MKGSKFGPMIVATVLVLAVVLTPLSMERAVITRHEVAKAAESLDPHVFQGVLMQQKMLENPHYLPIYGSSELLRLDRYHPTNYFKVRPDGFTPFLIGRGGMYSLVHFLNMAAAGNELTNRKIVFILSPEWFTAQGLQDIHFHPNFSKEQVYHLVFYHTISNGLREKAARRLLHFHFIRKDHNLTTLLENAAYPGHVAKPRLALATIQGYLTYKVLTLHDFIEMHRIKPGYKKHQYQKPDPRLANNSWANLRLSAKKMTERETDNNRFHIKTSLYNKHIRGRLGKFKDYRKNERYNQSPEYDDLQLVLDLLKQKHVQALFVSVPFNGHWYDYAGVPKIRREVAYRKIATEIHRNGFELADFTRFDSKPFFLQDTMHIGPMGWVYIDQAIKKFYNQH
ncbi:MAG: D-alanyl-lipoteichoic acid biosynthesis protein DltD [Sporolactobacillus sp.]